MFDCVEKKSLLKRRIKYDYDIKTSQNIMSSELGEFSEKNYELSKNGICPRYCKQCKKQENNQTIECIEWAEVDIEDEDEEEEEEEEEDEYKLYICYIPTV